MTNEEFRMTNELPMTEGRMASASARHSSFVIHSSFAIRHWSFPRRGFTLIEILVVLSIISLMLGISIISISGIKDEDRLRRAVAMIETTARDNLLQAVKTQQLVTMPLAAGSFGTGSDFSGMLKIRRAGERGFREPKRGETWEFSPTGICEPIEVRLSGPGGTVELAFDALTACAKRKSLDFNAKS
jgi:prepilin-type N-terminal cleavage/methylation domain-containing protein